jgi:hypothetical protein
VSALGEVHTLNISGCRRVVDITALVNVHTSYHDVDDDDDNFDVGDNDDDDDLYFDDVDDDDSNNDSVNNDYN